MEKFVRPYWPPSAKLDADAVQGIRARYPAESMVKLGAEFGVTPQNIRHIVLNISFYEAEYTPAKLGPPGRHKANGKANGHGNGHAALKPPPEIITFKRRF
jgi:hypothetical protein